ncbi:MAG: pseudouridine synthase [Clostridia bacterium]|nr:pseudouridine synthase [Clostridia bacterium]
MLLRLDKALADMQAGTRSQVKELIRKKRITVNGDIVTKPEFKVDTDKDTIFLDDKCLSYTEYEYYMLNKPAGVISATEDKSQQTVIDLIKTRKRKDLFPVGRLDKDTEGLLLITNDGALAHNLLSPGKHVDKTYYSIVKGRIDKDIVDTFAKGFIVDKELTAMPSKLEIISYNSDKDCSEVNITIQEGKFHQIKRMFAAVGSEVLFLKRLSFGSLGLDNTLKPGEYRSLTETEVNLLKNNQNYQTLTK